MTKEGKFNYRLRHVKCAQEHGIKPTARLFHTSAAVVRKWLRQYESERLRGLEEKSRRPKYSPNKCSPEFEEKVIRLRKETKFRYGAERLIHRFNLEYGPSCVQRIIKEHGFVLSNTTVQMDNGAEFFAGGQKKKGKTPVEHMVEDVFHAQIGRIPPASPTFNSDVKTL